MGVFVSDSMYAYKRNAFKFEKWCKNAPTNVIYDYYVCPYQCYAPYNGRATTIHYHHYHIANSRAERHTVSLTETVISSCCTKHCFQACTVHCLIPLIIFTAYFAHRLANIRLFVCLLLIQAHVYFVDLKLENVVVVVVVVHRIQFFECIWCNFLNITSQMLKFVASFSSLHLRQQNEDSLAK